jgi:hypothetical protein
VPDDNSNIDTRAEKLYNAVVLLLRDSHTFGLLAAVGDARDGMPWDKVAPKTRDVFRRLVLNLTEAPSMPRLEP